MSFICLLLILSIRVLTFKSWWWSGVRGAMSYSISVPGDEDATTNDLNRWSSTPLPLSYCTGLKSFAKLCPIFSMVPPSLYHQWHPPPHQYHPQYNPLSHSPPTLPDPQPDPPHPDPPHRDHPDKEGIMAVLAPYSPSIIPNCSSFAGLLPLLLAHLLLTNLLEQIPNSSKLTKRQIKNWKLKFLNKKKLPLHLFSAKLLCPALDTPKNQNCTKSFNCPILKFGGMNVS